MALRSLERHARTGVEAACAAARREGAPLAGAEVLVPVPLAPGPELAGLGDDRRVRLKRLHLAPAGIEHRGLIEAHRARGPLAVLVLREGPSSVARLRRSIPPWVCDTVRYHPCPHR